MDFFAISDERVYIMKKDRRDNRNKSQSRSFGQDDRSFGGGFSSGHNNRSYSSAPRELHKAICVECKNSCEVPFKPTEGKPVYCRDCFRKKQDRF